MCGSHGLDLPKNRIPCGAYKRFVSRDTEVSKPQVIQGLANRCKLQYKNQFESAKEESLGNCSG
jgi:hypothetical protein